MEGFSFACKIKCPNCGSLRDAKMVQVPSKDGKRFTWKRLFYDCPGCSVNKIKKGGESWLILFIATPARDAARSGRCGR